MLLLNFSANYADEFDVKGFCVMSSEDWEEHKLAVAKAFEKKAQAPLPEPDRPYSRRNEEARQIEVYFGTNESIFYESYNNYLKAFDVKSISDDDFKTLKRLFGKTYYGRYHGTGSGRVVMIDTDNFLEEES